MRDISKLFFILFAVEARVELRNRFNKFLLKRQRSTIGTRMKIVLAEKSYRVSRITFVSPILTYHLSRVASLAASLLR